MSRPATPNGVWLVSSGDIAECFCRPTRGSELDDVGWATKRISAQVVASFGVKQSETPLYHHRQRSGHVDRPLFLGAVAAVAAGPRIGCVGLFSLCGHSDSPGRDEAAVCKYPAHGAYMPFGEFLMDLDGPDSGIQVPGWPQCRVFQAPVKPSRIVDSLYLKSCASPGYLAILFETAFLKLSNAFHYFSLAFSSFSEFLHIFHSTFLVVVSTQALWRLPSTRSKSPRRAMLRTVSKIPRIRQILRRRKLGPMDTL